MNTTPLAFLARSNVNFAFGDAAPRASVSSHLGAPIRDVNCEVPPAPTSSKHPSNPASRICAPSSPGNSQLPDCTISSILPTPMPPASIASSDIRLYVSILGPSKRNGTKGRRSIRCRCSSCISEPFGERSAQPVRVGVPSGCRRTGNDRGFSPRMKLIYAFAAAPRSSSPPFLSGVAGLNLPSGKNTSRSDKIMRLSFISNSFKRKIISR